MITRRSWLGEKIHDWSINSDTPHIVHWINGGPSDLDNYALLCGYHHRLIHQDHWQIRTGTDRHPEFIPPRFIDPDQQPRHNNRPRHHHTRHNPTRKPDG